MATSKSKDRRGLFGRKSGTKPQSPEMSPEVEKAMQTEVGRKIVESKEAELRNEAAKRAVNCIIDASGVHAKKCKLWDLHEPWIFSFYRWKDKRRYKKGLAWNVEIPWIMSFAIHVLVTIKNLFTKKRK